MMPLRYAGISYLCSLRHEVRHYKISKLFCPFVMQMLAKKVDTLTKAMEVEAKKMRREVAAMEKEVAAMRVDKDQEIKARRLGNSKGPGSSQLLPGR